MIEGRNSSIPPNSQFLQMVQAVQPWRRDDVESVGVEHVEQCGVVLDGKAVHTGVLALRELYAADDADAIGPEAFPTVDPEAHRFGEHRRLDEIDRRRDLDQAGVGLGDAVDALHLPVRDASIGQAKRLSAGYFLISTSIPIRR